MFRAIVVVVVLVVAVVARTPHVLQRALEKARPGLPAEPTFNLNGEDGPNVGEKVDGFVFCEKKKLSRALFYKRALTCCGKKMPDVATADVEHSSLLVCHG